MGSKLGPPLRYHPISCTRLWYHHMMLLRFAQSLGGCAPSLHSVAGGTLSCFAQSLGGRSLASLSHWGDAPLLCSVAGGTLPRFAQLLVGRSLASLSRWGDAPSLRSVTGGCSLALLSHFPFNGSIKLLQNLHSRGSMKQHFYVWEPHCGYLHKVKMANRAINMHSRGSTLL